MIAMIKRLQVDTFREYQEELLRLRTSPNGVFGFKAHFDQWEFFRIAGEFGRPVNLRFILIERRDIVAQAVSFSRALQTDRWGSNMVERKAKAYDFDHILDAMRELHRQLEGWRGWFPEQRITPLRVTYESLVTNPTDVIAGILSAFDKTADPGQGKSAPSTAPIADQTSREWIERFTKEGLERGILRRA
jgi:LPS sulfotransferase NodH